MPSPMKKWNIFSGAQILGRVYTNTGQAMAERMAQTIFPDVTGYQGISATTRGSVPMRHQVVMFMS